MRFGSAEVRHRQLQAAVRGQFLQAHGIRLNQEASDGAWSLVAKVDEMSSRTSAHNATDEAIVDSLEAATNRRAVNVIEPGRTRTSSDGDMG